MEGVKRGRGRPKMTEQQKVAAAAARRGARASEPVKGGLPAVIATPALPAVRSTATPAVEPLAKRKALTTKQRVEIFDRAGGICHLCGEPIDGSKERWEAEHVHARGLGGEDSAAVLKPAHVECHKPKTADDKRAMAKVTRARAKHIGADKNGEKPKRTGLEGRTQEEKREAKAPPSGRLGLPPRRVDVYGRKL